VGVGRSEAGARALGACDAVVIPGAVERRARWVLDSIGANVTLWGKETQTGVPRGLLVNWLCRDALVDGVGAPARRNRTY
jgi:hypothetical protein